MQSEKVLAESTEVEGLRVRIEAWRTSRPRTRSMPEGLWNEAVAVARELGIYRVSRALGLNYDTLKRRAGSAGAHRGRGRAMAREQLAPTRTDFVEVKGLAELSAAASSGATVVEVVASDGARLIIRLPTATTNVAALVQAFRSRA